MRTQEGYNCSYFWPGSFAKGGEIDHALTPGLSYGEVILLDCKIIEVGKAVIRDSNPSWLKNPHPRGSKGTT